MDAAPTFLYRLYDADDQLLYIGITCRPAGRFAAHAIEKAWWASVARRDLEEVDAISAGELERAAIKAEQPRYNVIHGQALRVDRRPGAGQPVVIEVPRELHQALKERAAAEDRTMAATIRRACYHYLGTVAIEALDGGEGR